MKGRRWMELAIVAAVLVGLLLFGRGNNDWRARRSTLVSELQAKDIYTRDRSQVDWLLAHLLLLYPKGPTTEQIQDYVRNRVALTDALILTIESGDLDKIAAAMKVQPATLRAAMGKVRG